MTPPRTRTSRRGTSTVKRLVLGTGVLAVLVLAGCSEAQNNRQNSLDPKGPDAEKINNLFTPVAIIAILVGIFIILATIYVAVRFRYRPGKNESPKQVHGNTRLEIGWTIVPALLLAVIAVPTVGTIFDLAEPARRRRAPGDGGRQAVVVGVPVHRRQGRHRQRARRPGRPPGRAQAQSVRPGPRAT